MSNENSLASIVVINYNNEKYVVETLNSIASQTYPNIELIIVDDYSSDSSPQIIEEWLANNPLNARFVRQEKNKGVCVACNIGFRLATGKYVSYIATDDIMMPQKIEIQVNELSKTDKKTVALYSDAYQIDERGQLLHEQFLSRYKQNSIDPPSGDIYNELIKGNFIPAMSMMFKREVFEQVGYFDEALPYEDYDMWLRIAKEYKFYFSRFMLVKYRVRSASLSSTFKDWDSVMIKIYSKHLNHPDTIRKIERSAFNLYMRRQKKDLEAIRKIKGSIFLKVINAFSFLRIPRYLGYFPLRIFLGK
jgi:glycosyltransferase involved in cell wall biosynthesis